MAVGACIARATLGCARFKEKEKRPRLGDLQGCGLAQQPGRAGLPESRRCGVRAALEDLTGGGSRISVATTAAAGGGDRPLRHGADGAAWRCGRRLGGRRARPFALGLSKSLVLDFTPEVESSRTSSTAAFLPSCSARLTSPSPCRSTWPLGGVHRPAGAGPLGAPLRSTPATSPSRWAGERLGAGRGDQPRPQRPRPRQRGCMRASASGSDIGGDAAPTWAPARAGSARRRWCRRRSCATGWS